MIDGMKRLANNTEFRATSGTAVALSALAPTKISLHLYIFVSRES
jgi:hypothetical protein